MKDQQPKKSMWKPEEDMLLKRYVETYGEGKWSAISKKLGLLRDGKSCRLRWKNYLRPDIKHGSMSKDEEDLIVRMHKLLGNRWSLIAGRLPGRTDNEVKNYWNTHLSKKTVRQAKRKSVANNEGNRAKRVKFEQNCGEESPSFPVDDARDNKNYNENKEEENWSTLIRDQLLMELDATENLNCDFVDTSSFTSSLNHNTLLIYGVDEDCKDQALELLPWDHWSYVNLFDTFGSEFYSDNV